MTYPHKDMHSPMSYVFKKVPERSLRAWEQHFAT